MVEIAHSIDLNLPEKLRDREYRQRFFLAECSAQIAAQLIALRKRRDLNQQEVAELIGTQQPAISRIEKADYQSWSFGVLRKIADALDARIRLFIEPSEDVLREYNEEHESESANSELAAIKEILRPNSSTAASSQGGNKQVRRLASLLTEDDTSAAHYRPDVRKPSEVPKLINAEYSAALQRPNHEPIDPRQSLASWN